MVTTVGREMRREGLRQQIFGEGASESRQSLEAPKREHVRSAPGRLLRP